jgi:ABC-type antimicrobial peptide transport system permease subunit
MLRESAVTIALGAAAGVAGAAGAARLLTTRVFGLSGQDVALVVPAVAGLLVAAAVVAALPSARQAAAADPLEAMRTE